MEEMREAALAYYANFSEEQKESAKDFFHGLDSNGDGKITLKEYRESLKQLGFTWINNLNFFKDLDTDGDGYLDFEEVITLYYICVCGRLIFCDGCGFFLKGLYFTCVQCFDSASSYDLCCSCYRNKNFEHKHGDENKDDGFFLDNYTLLRINELITSEQENDDDDDDDGDDREEEEEEQQGKNKKLTRRKRDTLRKAVSSFKVGAEVASLAITVASGGCSIM